MKNKLLFLVALFLFSGARPLLSQDSVQKVRAVRADEFLGSMGVVSSVASRGEKLDETIESMKYTGLRWVRAGYEDDVPVDDFIRLYRETGVKTSYGLLSGGDDIDRLTTEAKQLAVAGALLAIEGANEPNNWGITHESVKGGGRESWLPVAKLHRDLYRAVKADPVLKKFPVWAISENGAQTDNTGLQFLTRPDDAATSMPAGTRYADFANCHNYISHPSWPGLHDNQTWLSSSPFDDCPVDGLYGNYGLTWAGKFPGYSAEELADLPRVTTETGYAISPEDGVTEEVQARLFLNLYLSQFKRGWKHTAVYLLKGRANEPDHEKFAFDTLRNEPKRAAHCMHNFTHILADKKSDKRPGFLSYTIKDRLETTHDLLLQKSDGTFMLVLWGERYGSGGTDDVTIEFGKSRRNLRVFDPTVSHEAIGEYNNTNSVNISLSDHPVIVEVK
jgi:hypothetical protein